MYKNMLAIRRFEEHVGRLFADGKIPGFAHRLSEKDPQLGHRA
jgi:TPP-dependent pyruvate/acetoin dehydrogenase alpha subunit